MYIPSRHGWTPCHHDPIPIIRDLKPHTQTHICTHTLTSLQFRHTMQTLSGFTTQSPNLFSDVCEQERSSSEVVDGEVEESLDLLVPQVQRDELMHACLAHHGRDKFGRDATSLAHLAVPTVWQVRNDTWF